MWDLRVRSPFFCPFCLFPRTCRTLWVNHNYNATRELLGDLTQRIYYGKTVLVVNEESIAHLKAEGRDGFVADYIALKDNDVARWDNDTWRGEFVQHVQDTARRYDGHLFIVSGGPIGKVLVNKLWEANCRNKYIDFGSAVDPLFRNKVTRAYHQAGHHHAQQVDPPYYVYDGKMRELEIDT